MRPAPSATFRLTVILTDSDGRDYERTVTTVLPYRVNVYEIIGVSAELAADLVREFDDGED